MKNAKLSASKEGSKNPHWKGTAVGYRAAHMWVNKYHPKTGICEDCGMATRTDYALIVGGTISRERTDYRELCRGCHMQYDLGGKKRPSVGIRIKEGKQRRHRECLEWAFSHEHIGKVK
jgi:hypothetical protein